jgi:hypothetical protein
MLPIHETMFFHDSSFFDRPDGPFALPSPEEVRSAATNPRHSRPPPVRFPALGLIVKFGLEITIAEGQCLWAIRRFFPRNVLPVPEIYGWTTDGDQVFLYMELVEGATLEERWPDLSPDDKLEICKQLRMIFGGLRQFEQDPADQFVGARQTHLFSSRCASY